MTYLIKTHQLSKSYAGHEVVSNLNMNVKKGEIYGFLGPNGAGKTTVMKMMTNLIKPSSGEIELFGEKVTGHSYEMLKRIGSIIEFPVFYDKLSARENLQLHCEYAGYYNHLAIEEALSLVNLQQVNDKPVKSFSLGMRQRLGIARAIMTKPELLILDEPTNGLDPVGIKELRGLFRMLCDEYRITILISSHILSEVEQIADTIGVINKGQLIEEVTVREIHERNTEYIEIRSEDTQKALYVLEEILGIDNFKVIADSKIRIYSLSLTQGEIAKQFVLNGVHIEEIKKKSHSLEDYFINLLDGGLQHAEVTSSGN
ncbi:ABC transporter ATP-binding protein [Paenibacillus bovis]|uniref:Bacitracin ABC transporter ATP-binding protein n=1 Tax=Paenibacillus bovis TaxID=1616788 RepID=A0A172ZJH0_9BACL|nr:ABC transporter ATP-binding protein [Paenibacillus bovis]ANF97771.1 bacitracin ABC transporter ATP-binding protein [Paenibacillus bovis]